MNKFFKFILNSISIYTLSNWLLNDENKSRKIKLKSNKIIPKEKSIIDFITENNCNPGWYLFGILHYGRNNRVYGNLFLENYKFKQSRPMYPSKRRWRVIRLKRKSKIILELLNVEEVLDLREIWLIKIPYFEALRRIKKRLNNNGNNHATKKNNKANIWRQYNILLKSQFKKSHIYNYADWIGLVEKKYNKLINNKKSPHTVRFHIRNEDNYSLEKDTQSWIIFISKNHKINKYAKLISEWILLQESSLEFIYFDEDQINQNNQRFNPDFKTSWNRELLFNDPTYISSCLIKATTWNNAIKNLILNKYHINIYTIIIFITSNLEINKSLYKIAHVPFIGFSKVLKKKHQNNINNKINSDFLKSFINKNKNYYGEINYIKTEIKDSTQKLIWKLPDKSIMSILIPIKDRLILLKKCINSIIEFEPGIDIEIIILNNESKEIETLNFLSSIESKFKTFFKIKVIDVPGEFNFSKINNLGSKYANGNVLLLLNNDVYFIKKGWGYALAQNALRKDIGFVGAKLFYEDMTIQHAGVIMGINGVAGHSHKFFPNESSGYMKRLIVSQEFSALTAACLAISTSKFETLGGFNEKSLKVNYNDVDLCLRAKEIGLKNIFLPEVEAIHLESKSRGKPYGKSLRQWKRESNYIKKFWYNYIKYDPFYNKNLSLDNEQYTINTKSTKHLEYRLGNFPNYKKLI